MGSCDGGEWEGFVDVGIGRRRCGKPKREDGNGEWARGDGGGRGNGGGAGILPLGLGRILQLSVYGRSHAVSLCITNFGSTPTLHLHLPCSCASLAGAHPSLLA